MKTLKLFNNKNKIYFKGYNKNNYNSRNIIDNNKNDNYNKKQ